MLISIVPLLSKEKALVVFNRKVLDKEIEELLPLVKEYILVAIYIGIETWEEFIQMGKELGERTKQWEKLSVYPNRK